MYMRVTSKPIYLAVSFRNLNKGNFNKFFNILDTIFMNTVIHLYPPDCMYNVDEMGHDFQSKVPIVIGRKRKRQIGVITSAERGFLITVVCEMSSGGTFVPPMVIFPRKNMTCHNER